MLLRDDLRGVWDVLHGSRAGPSIFLGTIAPALSLTSLAIAAFVVPISSIAAEFLFFYRDTTQRLFWPIEVISGVEVPSWLRDVLVFWAVSGAIGAGTWLLLFHRMSEFGAEVARNATSAGSREAKVAQGRGEEYERGLDEAKEIAASYKIGKLESFVTVLLGAVAGPLAFAYIWHKCPPMAGTSFNGRVALLLYTFGVLGWTVVLFGLSFVGPAR